MPMNGQPPGNPNLQPNNRGSSDANPKKIDQNLATRIYTSDQICAARGRRVVAHMTQSTSKYYARNVTSVRVTAHGKTS